MAYPLSADQIAQYYMLIGVPQGGVADYSPVVASFFGPYYEAYSFSALITVIDARLAALTSAQCTIITTLLTRASDMGWTSQLMISKGTSGVEGTIVDDPSELREIRKTLAKMIGFNCPSDGWLGSQNNKVVR